MLALSRSDVDIFAITCVNGNVDIDNVCRNTLRVLKVCDRLDVREITLIALAPLTNISLALRFDPDFGGKLKEVFIMGGNIEGRGNINLCAEFNFYADPEAAYITIQELKCPINILSMEAAEANGIEWIFKNCIYGKGTVNGFNFVTYIDKMRHPTLT
ncbi:nucleoside hydrolase-like [Mytilus galloprovincialis]|uniref:nucleoside hydrolase-like n=1 Tax=Mytilus galloprovincialis TaxID=29158 RepID=UPI003F7C4EAE